MKIALVNYSDCRGGAARAAYRIHKALRQYGIDSVIYVNEAGLGDWTVHGPKGDRDKFFVILRRISGWLVSKVLKTENPVIHSPAILPSSWPQRLNNLDVDILHLHWVNSEMLSVGDIGRLRKPVVWTLHDMWAFCGAEHYTNDFRWREGYTKWNRPTYEKRFDLNYWTWKRKIKSWTKPMHIVAPSHWLADYVRQSKLMRDWPVHVIPNAIDTDIWQPISQNTARTILNLPLDVPLLLFGALGGSFDFRKGFDLLLDALRNMEGEISGLELVIFGELEPQYPVKLGYPVHYTGHISDDVGLRLVYSAVDAFVLPSRQDNLPNTGVEALACGTPVIAFDTCGLLDIVKHLETGYLAKAFDTADLAGGIAWVLQKQLERDNSEQLSWLGQNSRNYALKNFSNSVVAEKYNYVYKTILDTF